MLSFYTKDEIRRFTGEIRLQLSEDLDSITDTRALEIIENYVFSLDCCGACSHEENVQLIELLFLTLRREMGILQPLVDDRSISEIMVNGKDNIFVEKNGVIEQVPMAFDSTDELEELIRRIAGRVHREINELNPIVDARLADGSRVNAVYRNVALNGPILTIRKFPERVMTMGDFIRNGTITLEGARLLRQLVLCEYNCFVSGGTSSGKTTMLNVLAQLIPSDDRVVVIEDSAELQLDKIDNIVRMECRNANVQGKGQIDMTQLVKASLRMRPDRIVIGEVRGGEVFAMINAMNTGHSGSLSTGHANSISGMLKRLEAMFMQAVDFPIDAIRTQISEGLDIIIHMSRMKDGSRRVVEIAELDRVSASDGQILTNPLYRNNGGLDCGLDGESDGRLNGGLTGSKLIHREKLELGTRRIREEGIDTRLLDI